MCNKYIKNLIRIAYVFVACIAMFLIGNRVFGWYTGTSNDATANSTEIKTVTTGYGGRFTTEGDYIGHSDMYENATVVTKKTVKPGDVVFFTFIMEFDSTIGSTLSGASYDIDIVLNAGFNSNDDYHGVTTGDYLSFLENVTIPANSLTMAIAKRSYDSSKSSFLYHEETSYDRYSQSNQNTITNLAVTSFYQNNTVGCKLRVTFPNSMSYPTSTDEAGVNDNKIYFMLYLPILYKDTNLLQNNEKNSYFKVGAIIYNRVGN